MRDELTERVTPVSMGPDVVIELIREDGYAYSYRIGIAYACDWIKTAQTVCPELGVAVRAVSSTPVVL
jgi:hypothetical protein